MNTMKKICLLALVLGVLSVAAGEADAAQISFTMPTTAAAGDSIVVQIRLDTGGASINAADLTIIYPKILRPTSISKSGSALQLWVREPSFTDGAIFLSGGSPGGFSGNVLLATVTFEAAAIGEGSLGLAPGSTVLVNDGSGTAAPLSLQTQTIQISPRKPSQTPQTVGSSATTKQSSADVNPPESFGITIGKDARLFGGKYFASFFTFDTGSGVDHYSIKEGNGAYHLARSPYLLDDQNLHSVIRVRAYDAAGNYREVVYPNIFIRIWWWIRGLFGK